MELANSLGGETFLTLFVESPAVVASRRALEGRLFPIGSVRNTEVAEKAAWDLRIEELHISQTKQHISLNIMESA